MYEKSIKLPNNKTIVFTTEDENECGKQLIASFEKSLPFIPKNSDIEDEQTWKTCLENDINNRDCTYILDNIWKNIITQIEKDVLESRGYPTNILDIIKRMCDDIVKGVINDWNDLQSFRLRSGEVFISLLQKQILAAFSEYKAKHLAGDEDAKFYINPTTVLSQIITSQNVQTLENINPVEELSSMTRVSPIGIGGLKSNREFPLKAQNIHYSYFGNIDPLDGPDSADIGIQQYLSHGTGITNIRGLFAEKDRKTMKPSELLSTAPSMIPFLSNNDGIRVVMSSSQQKQCIPLENPENPAVQTGYESALTPLLSQYFIKKSPVDGIIKKISNDIILIVDEFGNNHPVDIKPMSLHSGMGLSGLSRFKPTVTINEKVKLDQVIAEGANVKNGVISNGVNLLCTFMPYEGMNFEDGMVISENAASKFTSVHEEVFDVYLKEGEDIAKVAHLGDHLKKGDILISYSTTAEDVETLQNIRCNGGDVVAIEVFSNLDEENIPDMLYDAYENFKERYITLNGKYPLKSFKERGKDFEGILVKFYLHEKSYMKLGDKVNNRSFNKGIISKIMTSEENPQVPWGQKIDIIYSPLSIVNRMNPGQLYELSVGLISKTLGSICLNKPRKDFENALSKSLPYLDGTPDKTLSNESLSKLKSMSDGMYEKLKHQISNNGGFFNIVVPPFKNPTKENIQKALSVLGLKDRYKVFLPKYNKWTTSEVPIGYIYVMKLEQQVEKKISFRTSGNYNSKLMTPTKGGKDDRPNLIGEYDNMALIMWQCETVIDELMGPLSSDHVTKHEYLSDIIQNGKTNYRPSRTNPTKDVFANMMLALHLSSD